MNNIQQDGSGRTFEDPRPVPPLGWCAQCVRHGAWLRAAVLWQGTGLCAQCMLGEAGMELHDDVDPTDAVAVSRARTQLLDGLRAATRRNTPVAGI